MDLANSVIAILGLGLMGGSLAKALRGRCRSLLAYDPDPGTVSLALQERIVDQAVLDAREILPKADLVLLAAPVRAIIALIHNLPDWHPGGPVVIDMGSTKTQVCQALAELPARFDPLGGHPMCGKTAHGLVNAEAELFQSATFAFTTLPRTGERARRVAVQLADAIGAHPLWLEAEVHDRWVASTSHLPYLLACALSLVTPAEYSPLVGPGFYSSSRLAGSSVPMMNDILHTNRENVLNVLRALRAELSLMESCLEQQNELELVQIMERAANHHQALVGTRYDQEEI